MTMEYTKQKEECGCRINQAYNEKPFISYCPLHKAAPDLYEALKEVKLVWQGLDPHINFPHLNEVIEQALAKVDRG